MVTPLAFRLVSKMIQSNGSFLASLLRIQCGFLPRRNLEDAYKYVQEFQDTLKEVDKQLK